MKQSIFFCIFAGFIFFCRCQRVATTETLPDADTQPEKSEIDSIRRAYNYREAAMQHSKNNATDSANIYYLKALDIAVKNERMNRFATMVFNDLALLHSSKKEYKEALEYIEKSLQHRTNRKDATLFTFTKARIFLSLNETDSARFYLNQTIESSKDNYISILAYRHLSELYKSEENYEQAFYKILNHNSFIENAESEISTTVLTQRFKEVQLENENNTLKLAKRNREFALLSIIFFITVVLIVFWYFYSSSKKKEKIRAQQQREQELKNLATIAEQENRILKQENELSRLNEKAAVLRESLFRKLAVSEKIPSLYVSSNHEKENNHKKISLEQSDWEELIETTDEVFGGYSSRLKKTYPQLTDDDIQFCCLLKINVSMQDLADIYCISKAGITKKKMRMKKEKFNITDNQLDLNEFLMMY